MRDRFEHVPECEHVRSALVSSGGAISGVSRRSELRNGVGNVRWCTDCGAIQGVVGDRVSEWMSPGSDAASRALKALRNHEADLPGLVDCKRSEADEGPSHRKGEFAE